MFACVGHAQSSKLNPVVFILDACIVFVICKSEGREVQTFVHGWMFLQSEGPKLATRGGEWEPIKISFEIDLLTYIPKITTNPQIQDDVWSSYRRAKPTKITARNEREKARK